MNFYSKIIKDPIKVYKRGWRADARGRLLEVLRNDDEAFSPADFGQAYITTVSPGITKAWHLHENQTDRMILIKGSALFGCVDTQMSPTVLLSLAVSDWEPAIIRIPPKIYHGFKNIGKEEALILNIPDRVYNYKEPDEMKYPPTLFQNTFDWSPIFDG